MKKIFYRVEKSDTLCSLERRFNIPKSKIVFDNNLKGEILAGDLLVLNILDFEYYTIKPFENLTFLSKKFNMEEREILSLNKIEYIYPFQNIWVKRKE